MFSAIVGEGEASMFAESKKACFCACQQQCGQWEKSFLLKKAIFIFILQSVNLLLGL